jgi:hypothetical protein
MGDHPGSERPVDEVAGDADQREHDADEREAMADEREIAQDAREARADVSEAVRADRKEQTQHILDVADERDIEADARDSAAHKRDMDASLESFLHDDKYGQALKARRAAAGDRMHSKADRNSSAEDRSSLTEEAPPTPAADEA